MSVLINQATDQTFIGNLKAAVATVNGVFVVPNYVDQSATPAADAAAGDKTGLLLVANVNTAIDEQQVSDANFPIPAGRKLRLKTPLPGFTFTTDQYTGTPAVGDVVAVGAGGKLVAVAARTPLMTLRVKEVTTLFGKPAIKVVVETV